MTDTTVTYVIPLATSGERERRDYGVTHRSTFVYRVWGSAAGSVHNRRSPHRVSVWDNTRRPNTAPDEWNEFTGRPGPGRWLDPSRRGTDDAVTVLLSAEPVSIDSYDTGTGTPGSGQVYGDVELKIGDRVTLVYPDGGPIENYTVTSRVGSDPVLVPVTGA